MMHKNLASFLKMECLLLLLLLFSCDTWWYPPGITQKKPNYLLGCLFLSPIVDLDFGQYQTFYVYQMF
jgi:hypothetical protein